MRLRNLASVAVILAVILVGTPRVLLAHAHLARSAPSAGAKLKSSPDALRLWFSESPELPFTRITLVGPDSGEVGLGPVSHVPGERLGVVVPVEGVLAPGTYTVIWQTAAADGHPTHGQFSFVVLPAASGGAPPAAARPPGTPEQHVEMMQRHTLGQPHAMGDTTAAEGQLGAESPAYIAVRWVTFGALLAMIGAIAFVCLVLPITGRTIRQRGRAVAVEALSRVAAARAARLGWIAGAVLIIAAIARLYVQSVAIHGVGAAANPAMLREMVTDTTWGGAWLVQVAAALVAIVALAVASRLERRRPVGGATLIWVVAALAVLVLAFTPALGGHAAGAPRLTALAIAADGLHVLGAGGWLGTLLVVAAVGVPVALGLGSPDAGGVVADTINAFSPTALAFASLVVLTGVISAWLHLGSFDALWRSAYGRVLLLKIAVLIPVLGTGAYNWLRIRPVLGSAAATARLRRSSALELAIGVVVVAVTAVLVALEPPV